MIRKGILKKLFILMILSCFIWLIGCDRTTTSQTLTTSFDTTASASTYTTEDEATAYIRDTYDIFKEVSLEQDVIDRITTYPDDTVYLDENIYVYRDSDPFSQDYHVYDNNHTYDYNMYTTNGPYPFAGFDRFNQEYLYLRTSSIVSTSTDTIFTNTNGNITQLRDFQIYGGYIIDYYGKSLKNPYGTVIYPNQNDLSETKFYSYTYRLKYDQEGCVFNSFDSLDSTPTETIIHDDYVCDGYTTVNNTYVFELVHKNTNDIKGFAVINPVNNQIYKVIFEDDYIDFDDSNDHAISIINNRFLLYYYYDSNDLEHYDIFNPSNGCVIQYEDISPSSYIYFDDTYQIYFDSSNQSHIIILMNNQPFTDLNLIEDDSVNVSIFNQFLSITTIFKENYLIVTQDSNQGQKGGLHIVSLTNGVSKTYTYDYFFSYDIYNENYLLIETSDDVITNTTKQFYYIGDDSFLSIDSNSYICRVSPTQFYYIDNDKLIFYDLTKDIPLEFELICEISCNHTYLVKYHHTYFILKTR